MDNEKAASVALGLREYAELYDDISTSVFSFISMGTRALLISMPMFLLQWLQR